jgi:hypothetical protein
MTTATMCTSIIPLHPTATLSEGGAGSENHVHAFDSLKAIVQLRLVLRYLCVMLGLHSVGI